MDGWRKFFWVYIGLLVFNASMGALNAWAAHANAASPGISVMHGGAALWMFAWAGHAGAKALECYQERNK